MVRLRSPSPTIPTSITAYRRAIHHDPELYENPDEFRPERYEDHELGFKPGMDSNGLRKTYAFGAGRRICPGQHLAENSLVRPFSQPYSRHSFVAGNHHSEAEPGRYFDQIINMSKIVWAFQIVPGNDTSGQSQLPDAIDDSMATAWTNGFLTAPKPFALSLAVRSSAHQETIDRETLQAQEVVQQYSD